MLRKVGRFLLAVVVLCVIFCFIAGFSIRQGTVLALFAAYTIYGFRVMTPLPNLTLEPHFVHIRPRWYEILTDLQLISSAAEYDELYADFSSIPTGQYNVFRDGVWYSVLDDEALGQRTLIYSDDFHAFVSEVDFERSLKPLTLSRESNQPSLRNYTPDLFVRWGALGVVVPDWWWKQKQAALSGKVTAEERFDTGTVRLTIATLPRSEFTVYWKRSSPYPKGEEILKRNRIEDRAKYGWTVKDKDERSWPEILEHKYFEVRHRCL